MVGISGANQGEVILIRDGEENATIGILAEISLRRIKHLAHDDVRSSHQTDGFAGFAVMPCRAREQVQNRRSCCVRDRAGPHGCLSGNFYMPKPIAPFQMGYFG